MFFSREINMRKMAAQYHNVFGSPEGKAVLRDLCVEHGILTNNFSPNAMKHAFNAGERNVVLRILAILDTSPEELQTLIKATRGDYEDA